MLQETKVHFEGFEQGNHPNVTIALPNSSPDATRQWKEYVYSLAKKPKEYFLQKVEQLKFKDVLEACQIFNPSRIHDMKQEEIGKYIEQIPILNELQIEISSELPTYITQASLSPAGIDILDFWKSCKLLIPTWVSGFRRLAALQPSSAAAERVFSILENVTTNSQSALLEDSLEVTLMRRYNYRQ